MGKAVEHEFKVKGCSECPWCGTEDNGFVDAQVCRLDDTCDNSWVIQDDEYPDSCPLWPAMTVRAKVMRPGTMQGDDSELSTITVQYLIWARTNTPSAHQMKVAAIPKKGEALMIGGEEMRVVDVVHCATETIVKVAW